MQHQSREGKWVHLSSCAHYGGDSGISQEARTAPLPVGVSTMGRKDAAPKHSLGEAAFRGKLDVVRYLADQGEDLNATGKDGRSALMGAVMRDREKVVRFLLDRGVAVNATDSSGTTALMLAAAHNRPQLAALLLERGADASAANAKGETAIRLAANAGHHEVVKLLAPLVPAAQPSPATPKKAPKLLSGKSIEPLRDVSWLIPPEEIELVQLIDTGGDYLAHWLGAEVVVKLYVPDAAHSAFADEAKLWQQLRHPNVIKLYGAVDDAGLQFFVCEYASGGSLANHLKACDLEPGAVWKFLHEAALGLEYLHERNVVHGDLRCSNILIGSDGLARLAGFGLSPSTQQSHNHSNTATQDVVGAMRWQSPEQLEGHNASVASDVYAFGMCIVEASTGVVPWAGELNIKVRKLKFKWRPEQEDESIGEPPGIHGDVRDLVLRMCCHDPSKRPSITSVVYDLERMVARELDHTEPEAEMACEVDEYKDGETGRLWNRLQQVLAHTDKSTPEYQALQDLSALHDRLLECQQRPKLLERFYELLEDLHATVTTLQSANQARIMQLSSTRAVNSSFHIFYRRLQLLWRMLDGSDNAVKEYETRWTEQRNNQIEFFVSEVSKTWLLLNQLDTAEERSAFLTFLKNEMQNQAGIYTPGQLSVMKKAYADISSQFGNSETMSSAPEWFVPWYELEINAWACLGKGGFGSVHRAKWLDSDVVVKQVLLDGDSDSSSSTSSFSNFSSSMSSSSPKLKRSGASNTAMKLIRAEALRMFKREADIWFGFSHPHVVRLFGACHVGRPFFVCEYATHGTLVDYIQAHPEQVWQKLHEAALGVLYLHERHVVHGDLKGNNIVVGSDRKAKVTDFGLSSIVTHAKRSNMQVTGAWHWVAPECLETSQPVRPTFASDVYSLGMCIVEAMRVVSAALSAGEPSGPSLPWGELDNLVVKVCVTKGELPVRPACCTDEHWNLVKRMCAQNPAERMSMWTVVDELARLAEDKSEVELTSPSASPLKSPTQPLRPIPDVIAASRARLASLQTGGSSPARRGIKGKKTPMRPIDRVYERLWERMELVYNKATTIENFEHWDKLRLLVQISRKATAVLTHEASTLRKLTERTLLGFKLLRRLEKFRIAYLRKEVCSNTHKTIST